MKITTLTIIALLIAGQVAAGPVAKDLQGLSSAATTDVVVQFASTPTKAQLSSVTAKGGTLVKQFKNMPMARYSLPTPSVNALSSNAAVVYASKNRQVKRKLDYANPTVNAPLALSAGWDGAGVGIAVIDSGVNSGHADLSGRVAYSENFVPTESTTADLFGHGTHVAVIAAGSAAASTGANTTMAFRGTAPAAKIVNLRVLDAQGMGTDAAVIQALDRAIDLKNTYNIRVINLSLGRPIYESYATDPLCRAAREAWKRGLLVVVAAGNGGRNTSMGTNGYSTISSPGNDPFVLTVGATKDVKTASRADDVVTTYSSKGPTLIDRIVKPDVVAPGNLIISAKVSGSTLMSTYAGNEVPLSYYTTTGSGKTSSDYYTLSGTSMATPVVAGIAAAMFEKTSSLTPDLVKGRIMRTATKTFPWSYSLTDGATYTVQHDVFTIGAGYVDMYAALNDSATGTAAALSPRVVFDSATGKVAMNYDYVNGTNVLWGDNVLWGENVVWGSNLLVTANGDQVVGGSNVVWGDTTTSGFNVVWGDNVLWGESTAPNLFDLALSAKGEK